MQEKPLKISIVIPTRNGAKYLQACIQTCLASNDKNLEIVVSDNCSVDNTREMVAGFSDSRLHYFHTGANLSMRQNFEFALSKATGDYIIYIGDDDGVLANGIATLRRVLEKYKPDVVNWRHITYKWPTATNDSILKFRPQDFFGPLYKKDPEKILNEFFAAGRTTFRDSAHIYHGCVSRTLVNKVRSKAGGYFMAHIPDVYTSLANLACAESFIWIRHPVSIGGESPKSNGAATTGSGERSKEQNEIVKDFIQVAAQDEIVPEIDLSIRSIVALVYANLVNMNNRVLNGSGKINHAGWRAVILAATDQLEAAIQRRQKEILYKLFVKADPSFIPPTLPPETNASVAETIAQTPSGKKKSTRPDLLTIEDARKWIDGVTMKSYLPIAFVPIALIAQAYHAAGIRKNILKM